jgi:hypothetical protein
MFEPLGRCRAAIEALRAEVGAVDFASLSGPEAAEAVAVFARATKAAHAGLALAAGRVEETSSLALAASRFRSTRDFVSSAAGISSFSAEMLVDLAGRLPDHPRIAALLRDGSLSVPEASEITRAAERAGALAAEATADLLDVAADPKASFSRLRKAAGAVQSPDPADDEKRTEAARARRGWRSWVDAEGVGHLHAQGPPDAIALLVSRCQARADSLFRAARGAGQRHSPGAYRFDALMSFFDTATPGGAGSAKARVDMLIRLDFAALLRGVALPGETCEIAGIGAVPVSSAVEYLGEAALKFILTDALDIKAVAHYGRNIRSPLRSALAWKYRSCAEAGCDATLGLEVDHLLPVGKAGMTSLDNLAPKCHYHHDQKTRRDYPGGTAAWRGKASKANAGGNAGAGSRRAEPVAASAVRRT